ncbi:MAG: phage major capsid protein, partial [bacterium]
INGEGPGSNEPDGVRNNGDVQTHAADMTDGGTIHDSVVDTYNTVIPKARAGGLWVTSPQGWALLAKAKDADNRPLIQQLAGEPFARLLGHPLFVTEAVPEDLGAGNDETELIFGNFRRGFLFGDRAQIEVKLNDGGKYFENFQLAIRVSERWDGAVGQAQYFVRGTGWV